MDDNKSLKEFIMELQGQHSEVEYSDYNRGWQDVLGLISYRLFGIDTDDDDCSLLKMMYMNLSEGTRFTYRNGCYVIRHRYNEMGIVGNVHYTCTETTTEETVDIHWSRLYEEGACIEKELKCKECGSELTPLGSCCNDSCVSRRPVPQINCPVCGKKVLSTGRCSNFNCHYQKDVTSLSKISNECASGCMKWGVGAYFEYRGEKYVILDRYLKTDSLDSIRYKCENMSTGEQIDLYWRKICDEKIRQC